jgi:hypothetical protein
MRGTVALVSALLLVGCSSSNSPDGQGRSVAQLPPFVRDCVTAVFGEPNLKNSDAIGPLVLVGIPQAAKLPPRSFEPHDGRYGAVKMLAVVRGSDDVTVTVASSQRDTVSLLYDPDVRANRNGFLFSAGDRSVTFEACPGSNPEPQYNGGFIATQPGCVTLDVTTDTSSTTGWVSIGAGRSCPHE